MNVKLHAMDPLHASAHYYSNGYYSDHYYSMCVKYGTLVNECSG